MRDTQKTIGIIGYGNMGRAIAERIKLEYQILIFDKDRNKIKNLSGIEVAQDAIDLINKADILILSIKPQDFDSLLKEIKNYVKSKLIISIAAGITTAYLEKRLGDVRVVRTMPNMGARIGKSVTCLCKGAFATDEDLALAEELFSFLGITKVIEEEKINAATAISGSGPAYIFEFIESNSIDPNNISKQTKQDIIKRLAEAAQGVGFNSEDAMFLAVNTTTSSIDLIKKTKMSPAELKKQIVSPGGTTEAALEVLRHGGSWKDAAQTALKRAEELSK